MSMISQTELADYIERVVPEDVVDAMGLQRRPLPNDGAVVGDYVLSPPDEANLKKWGAVLLRRGSVAAARLVAERFRIDLTVNIHEREEAAHRLLKQGRTKRNEFIRRAWRHIERVAA